MPSWNDGESSEDSLLSEFTQGDMSPPPPIPEHFVHPQFTGYENSDMRCNHEMPMYKYVCFEGEDTWRRFLACGCKEEVMCDKVVWVDLPWPSTLKDSLVKLWGMHDEERDTRIHGNVDYATKNYQLVLEKRELEKKNVELHKQLGNALQYVGDITTHDLELEVAKRQKSKKEVARLKQEKKKLELELGKRQKLEEEKKSLEMELQQKQQPDDVVASLKQEKKKLEYYISDMLKLAHAQKDKLQKISKICEE